MLTKIGQIDAAVEALEAVAGVTAKKPRGSSSWTEESRRKHSESMRERWARLKASERTSEAQAS